MSLARACERVVFAIADRWPAGAFCLFVRFFAIGLVLGLAAGAALAWWVLW